MNPTDPSDHGAQPRDSEADRSFRSGQRAWATQRPITLRAATIRKILWLILNLALLQASDIQLPEFPGLCAQDITQTKTAILKIGTCFYRF